MSIGAASFKAGWQKDAKQSGSYGWQMRCAPFSFVSKFGSVDGQVRKDIRRNYLVKSKLDHTDG